jgi:hypothetical protein
VLPKKRKKGKKKKKKRKKKLCPLNKGNHENWPSQIKKELKHAYSRKESPLYEPPLKEISFGPPKSYVTNAKHGEKSVRAFLIHIHNAS